MACSPSSKKSTPKPQITTKAKIVKPLKKTVLLEEPTVILNEKNAIPFLFKYQKQDLPVSEFIVDFIALMPAVDSRV